MMGCQSKTLKSRPRNAGIDLLKIIAIIFICIAHSRPDYVAFLDKTSPAYIDSNLASSNIHHVLLNAFNYFGQVGSSAFVICSAYFLVDSNKLKTSKIWNMIADTLIFSWIWFAVVYCLGFDVGIKDIIKTAFPITFGNNWFIGCYLLLYLIHPGLNAVIRSLDRRNLLIVNCVGFILYSCISMIPESQLYYTSLVGFVLIYFNVAYMKREMNDISNNMRINKILLLLCAFILLCMLILTNILGLKYQVFSDQMRKLTTFRNPFIILAALSLFNIFRNMKINSRFISELASVTLLIYIIHEDILFRGRIKPLWWIFVYEKFSYDYVVMWAILTGGICFILSIIIAFIYKATLKKVVSKICDWLNSFLRSLFNKAINLLLLIK